MACETQDDAGYVELFGFTARELFSNQVYKCTYIGLYMHEFLYRSMTL